MPAPAFDRTQIRILGTLIEKALTVPDSYPLTLKSLVSGCNQKSNRDPVLDLADYQVEGALRALFVDGWAGQHSREGGRVVRWNERLRDRLNLDRPASAVLAELMLRGPQPIGALRGRASRMAPIDSIEEAQAVLERLRDAELVELQPKRAGERTARWAHRIERETHEEASTADEPVPTVAEPPPSAPPLFALPMDPPRVVPGGAAERPKPAPAPAPAPPSAPPRDPEPETAANPGGEPATEYGAEPSAEPEREPPASASREVAALRDEIHELREEVDALRRLVEGLAGIQGD